MHMRKSLLSSAAVTLVILISCGGDATLSVGAEPLSGPPALQASRRPIPVLAMSLDNYFPSKVTIDKLLYTGEVGFAMVSVGAPPDAFRTVGTLVQEKGRWRAQDFPLDPTFIAEPPSPGSNEAFFGQLAESGQLAFWGLVDPTFTRIEVISESGQLLDVDRPSETGAVLILFNETAKRMRMFRNDQLVASRAIEVNKDLPVSSQ